MGSFEDVEYMEKLDNPTLENICKYLDTGSLVKLAETSDRIKNTCARTIKERKSMVWIYPEAYIASHNVPISGFYYVINDRLKGFFKEAQDLNMLKGPNGEKISIKNLLELGIASPTELRYLFDLYFWNIGMMTGASFQNAFISKPKPDLINDPLLNKWFNLSNTSNINVNWYFKIIIDNAKGEVNEKNVSIINQQKSKNDEMSFTSLVKLWEAKFLGITPLWMEKEEIVPQSESITDCSSSYDLISMTDWTETPPDIKIKFVTDQNKPIVTNCYQSGSLRQWVNDPSNTLARWVPHPGSVMDNMGHGGGPDSNETYIRLYTGEFLRDEGLVRIFLKQGRPGVFIAEPLGVVRLGNLQGSFGSSATHGQAPGYTVYKLRV